MTTKRISTVESFLTFSAGGVYFFILLVTVMPVFKGLGFNSAVPWFLTGTLVFAPLLAYAVIRAKFEGNGDYSSILSSLGLRKLTPRDWSFVALGLLVVFLGTGLVLGVSAAMSHYFGARPISTTPWFISITPFVGVERWLLTIWLAMFLFNILGEEFLWRGYLQNRMEGRFRWQKNAIFWTIFHIPFGLDLMLMLAPCLIVVPFAFEKTRNTWVGVLIHGLYNGPIFVLVALGIIKV